MVSDENTIYHIQYDYDLNGQTITLPAGSTLSFEGGSLSNGKINGNNSLITGDPCIYEDMTFGGTWENTETNSEWFAPSVTDFYVIMRELFHLTKEGGSIHVYRDTIMPDSYTYALRMEKSYKIDFHNTTLTLQERTAGTTSIKIVLQVFNSTNIIYGASISNLTVNATANLIDTSQFAGPTSFWGFIYASNVSDFTIENIRLAHTHQGIKFGGINNSADETRKNIYVRNCSIQGKMSAAFFNTSNVHVENCDFDCSDAENTYDHGMYVTDTQNIDVIGCTFSNALDAINLYNSGTVTKTWDIENAVLRNCKVVNCRRFVAIYKGRNISIENIYFENLQAKVSGGNDLWLSACKDISIDGIAYKSEPSDNRTFLIQGSNIPGGNIKISNLDIECKTPMIAISGTANLLLENSSFKLNGATADYSGYAIILDLGATSSISATIKKCVFDTGVCSYGQFLWIRKSSASVDNSAVFEDCLFKKDSSIQSRLLFDQLSRLGDIVVRNCGVQNNFTIKNEAEPKYFNCYRIDDGSQILDVPYYKYATKTNIDTVLTPLLTQNDAGYTVYDSTNSKMILWNGTAWVNMDGTALS